jgi:cation transport ATPase
MGDTKLVNTMHKSRTDHILVTHEELAALNGTDGNAVPCGDQGFKYRMLFLLTVVVVQTLRLLFYPHVAVSPFQAGAMDEATLHRYMTIRALFVMAISAIYLFSYLKDWYFEKVSMLYVGIAITALVMDYFNAYIYLNGPPAPSTAALIAVRFVAIYCLLMNALRAREAPDMPRSLWS